MRRSLWALVVVCLFAGRAEAQAQSTPGMIGEVRCEGGKPIAFGPADSIVGYPRAENLRHEVMHVAQFSIGCDSVAQLWATEPIYRLQLEAQATCVGIKAWPTDSLRRIRKGLAAARISAAYGNAVGFEDIYEALDHYCGVKR